MELKFKILKPQKGQTPHPRQYQELQKARIWRGVLLFIDVIVFVVVDYYSKKPSRVSGFSRGASIYLFTDRNVCGTFFNFGAVVDFMFLCGIFIFIFNCWVVC